MLCIFVFLMIPRPPRTTRTDTLLPYTTLCRSDNAVGHSEEPHPLARRAGQRHVAGCGDCKILALRAAPLRDQKIDQRCPLADNVVGRQAVGALHEPARPRLHDRSEERRVGKECVSTCRYRWSP